jgi:hypothetical protein
VPTLGDLSSIIVGPGGALALALSIILALGRGWLVPGFIYTDQAGRLDKALAGLEASTTAIDRLTDEIRTARPRARV